MSDIIVDEPINKRIREFAIQADVVAPVQGMLWQNHGKYHDMTPHTNEFAELIIRECAEFVAEDQGYGEELAARLRNQFGVD